MYDLEWAQKVYIAFCKDRTRTINLDLCILQRLREAHCGTIELLDVKKALIRSLACPSKQRLWTEYKKFVKGKLFDERRLQSICNLIIESCCLEKEREQQLLLF